VEFVVGAARKLGLVLAREVLARETQIWTFMQSLGNINKEVVKNYIREKLR